MKRVDVETFLREDLLPRLLPGSLLDLYADYLISSFGPTTATGLSALLEQRVSHDKITRFLSKSQFTSADL